MLLLWMLLLCFAAAGASLMSVLGAAFDISFHSLGGLAHSYFDRRHPHLRLVASALVPSEEVEMDLFGRQTKVFLGSTDVEDFLEDRRLLVKVLRCSLVLNIDFTLAQVLEAGLEKQFSHLHLLLLPNSPQLLHSLLLHPPSGAPPSTGVTGDVRSRLLRGRMNFVKLILQHHAQSGSTMYSSLALT